MRRLRCSCPPPGREYWKRPMCASCEKWWNLHRELDRELAPRPPWIWPHLNPPTLYPNHDGVLVRRAPIDHQVETTRRLREVAKAMRAIQHGTEVTIDVKLDEDSQRTILSLGTPLSPSNVRRSICGWRRNLGFTTSLVRAWWRVSPPRCSANFSITPRWRTDPSTSTATADSCGATNNISPHGASRNASGISSPRALAVCQAPCPHNVVRGVVEVPAPANVVLSNGPEIDLS
jgi:hypothetical protein